MIINPYNKIHFFFFLLYHVYDLTFDTLAVFGNFLLAKMFILDKKKKKEFGR